MKAEEFSEAWDAITEKLTADEVDLVDRVIGGAEVHHSMIYMLVTFALGGILGWALAGLI